MRRAIRLQTLRAGPGRGLPQAARTVTR